MQGGESVSLAEVVSDCTRVPGCTQGGVRRRIRYVGARRPDVPQTAASTSMSTRLSDFLADRLFGVARLRRCCCLVVASLASRDVVGSADLWHRQPPRLPSLCRNRGGDDVQPASATPHSGPEAVSSSSRRLPRR